MHAPRRAERWGVVCQRPARIHRCVQASLRVAGVTSGLIDAVGCARRAEATGRCADGAKQVLMHQRLPGLAAGRLHRRGGDDEAAVGVRVADLSRRGGQGLLGEPRPGLGDRRRVVLQHLQDRRGHVGGDSAPIGHEVLEGDGRVSGIDARGERAKRLRQSRLPRQRAAVDQLRKQGCGHRFGVRAEVPAVPVGDRRDVLLRADAHRADRDQARTGDHRGGERRQRIGVVQDRLQHRREIVVAHELHRRRRVHTRSQRRVNRHLHHQLEGPADRAERCDGDVERKSPRPDRRRLDRVDDDLRHLLCTDPQPRRRGADDQDIGAVGDEVLRAQSQPEALDVIRAGGLTDREACALGETWVRPLPAGVLEPQDIQTLSEGERW